MTSILRLAAITGSLMLATASIAQTTTDTPATTAPTKKVSATAPRIQDGFAGINLGMLIKMVGITPEQTEKLKALNSEYYKLHNAMPADMPMEERKAQVVTMMAERETKLIAELTPEQVTKYNEAKASQTRTVTPAPAPTK